MSLTQQVVKHVIWLLLTVIATIALVSVVYSYTENEFAAVIAFVVMVPVMGSAVVDLKRDWVQHREQGGKPQ